MKPVVFQNGSDSDSLIYIYLMMGLWYASWDRALDHEPVSSTRRSPPNGSGPDSSPPTYTPPNQTLGNDETPVRRRSFSRKSGVLFTLTTPNPNFDRSFSACRALIARSQYGHPSSTNTVIIFFLFFRTALFLFFSFSVYTRTGFF